MQRDTWIERVLLQCGLVETAEAERWMAAIMDVVSGLLSHDRASELAAALSSPPTLVWAEQEAPATAAALIDVLAVKMGWAHGQVADRLPAALSVLRDVAGPVLWAVVASELPTGAEPVEPVREARVPAPARGAHDLAAGRPGSRTPLGSDAPRAGQSDSIAASSDPRGRRKLSGAADS